MKRIYKYSFPQADIFDLELPRDAKILTVQSQGNSPFIWALIDDETKTEVRTFRFAGTGHPIKEEKLSYIGTFQIFSGSFVGHLFEIINDK